MVSLQYLKTRIWAISFFTILLPLSASSQPSKYLIMVGRLYEQQKCEGTTTFSNTYGHVSGTSNGSLSYSELETEVKRLGAQKYSVKPEQVKITPVRTQFGCVIKYEKSHSGWKCTTYEYAFGYGSSPQEAEAHAVRVMTYQHRKVDYVVLENIDAGKQH